MEIKASRFSASCSETLEVIPYSDQRSSINSELFNRTSPGMVFFPVQSRQSLGIDNSSKSLQSSRVSGQRCVQLELNRGRVTVVAEMFSHWRGPT